MASYYYDGCLESDFETDLLLRGATVFSSTRAAQREDGLFNLHCFYGLTAVKPSLSSDSAHLGSAVTARSFQHAA